MSVDKRAPATQGCGNPIEGRICPLVALSLFAMCCFVVQVFAQCPIQPLHASVDASGKNVEIRYYNSGSRAVQAVEFTLQRPQGGQNDSTVPYRYSTRDTLHPSTDKVAVFRRPVGRPDNIREAAQAEELEVQVTRVVFTDQSTWKPGRADTCKVSFSPR